MSDLTNAVLSHGLFITGGTTFPDPYDVRFGVDNGDGQLGTLTSPLVANVRLGIQYGGDGNQYTGTLYVAGTTGDRWTRTMDRLFTKEVGEWAGDLMLTYNAQTAIDALKKPISQKFTMNPNNYSLGGDTTFDVRRADAVTCGLYAVLKNVARPSVSDNYGLTYQVLDFSDDDTANPIIQLHCKRRQ